MKSVRTELILSLTAITMAFLSGALLLSVRQGGGVELTVPALQQEIQNFKNQNVELLEMRPDAFAEIVNPLGQLPTYFKFDSAQIGALKSFQTNCKKPKIEFTSVELKKAAFWQEYKCGLIKLLPETFFESAPLIHPSGHSYAWLSKPDKEWTQSHLSLFHISELKDLKLDQLSEPYATLSKLSWRSLDGLIRDSALIVDKNLVLMKDSDNESSRYKFYAKEIWNQFWTKTPYEARAFNPGERCFVRQDAVCWSYDIGAAFTQRWNPLRLLLIFSLIATVVSLALLTMKVRRRQADERRLKFALEMLAHEIRTPVTNLSFNVEQFRSEFDSLTDKNQSTLLKLFDQVERLKRVVDSSTNYLGKELGHRVLEPKLTELSSLRTFVEHTLDPYLDEIKLEVRESGKKIKTDPYWASLCIKNIVENAIKHGAKPVEVSVSQRGNSWAVEVSDKGSVKFDPTMTNRARDGLGLGLKIVREVASHLNGTLSFSYSPTIVRLEFAETK